MKCKACGSSMSKEGTNRFGLDVHRCNQTGEYPWNCFKCGLNFHMNESFPTSQNRVCPICQTYTIENEHCTIR